jgi:signal transduction histidine kinase
MSNLTPYTYTTSEAARIPWRQVAAAFPDMLVVVDAEGHTIFFNMSLAEALARPLRPDIAVDEHPSAYGLYRPDGLLYRPEELPVTRALREGSTLSDIEVVLRKPDGSQLITRWSAAPLRNDAGEIIGAVGTGRDETTQTLSRHWLQASERRALLLAELGTHFSASLDLREVLRRVARSTAGGLGDWCLIDLVDDNDAPRLRKMAVYHEDLEQLQQMQRLRRRYALSSDAGLAGQVLTNREPLWIHQVTPDLIDVVATPAEAAMIALMQPTALLLLPLISQGRVLGLLILAVSGAARPAGFSEDEYALAQEVASRAALAIENAQLYDRARRQVARLTALSSLALALSGSLVLEESGPPALSALLDASRTDMAALYVRDPTADAPRPVAAIGFAGEAPTPPSGLSQGTDSPARRVFAARHPIYSGDGSTTLSGAARAALTECGARSFVSLPIISRGEVIGSLLLLGRAHRRFSGADVAFLESAASQIALSIENARLYQHTRALLEELKHSNELKDEFISIASHELRTPLTAVRGYSEMLLRRVRTQPDREADLRALETIYLQVDRMNRLIGDLLDASRITSGHLELRPQRIDLVALVRHVVEQQQPLTPQHRFHFSAEPPMILGLVDGGRLEQVILNLLTNAVKYSPAGGLVEVSVTGDPAPDGEFVRISVRDQGIGVPPESLPHLFTRFYRATNAHQARSTGLGIGLYVSHQIVRAHGGEIRVSSLPGTGSTFTVELPQRVPPPGS